MMLSVLAHRMTGLSLRTPASMAMVGDLSVAMMTAFAFSGFVHRPMLWMTVPTALGMIATCVFPARAGLCFNVAMFGFVLVAAWQLRAARSTNAEHEKRSPQPA